MNRLSSRVSVIKQDLLDTGPQKPQFLRTERNIRRKTVVNWRT